MRIDGASDALSAQPHSNYGNALAPAEIPPVPGLVGLGARSHSHSNRQYLTPLKSRKAPGSDSQASDGKQFLVFSMHADQRCKDKKAKVYKRNQEEYLRQIDDALNKSALDRDSSRKRLAQFRQNAAAGPSLRSRNELNSGVRLEPLSLSIGPPGRLKGRSNLTVGTREEYF